MKIQLQKTLLGRTLRRLAGEEKGAVMMEYVVLGVLLVAACVAGVIVFGDRILASFGIMTDATGGNVPAAEAGADAGRKGATAGIANAKDSHDKIAPEPR